MTDGYESQVMAAETMLGDLMSCAIEQCKALPAPWQKISESQQKEVLDRVERQCSLAISKAVQIIASYDRPHMRATLKNVTFEGGIKCKLELPSNAENRDLLADASGGVVTLVITETDSYLGKSTAPTAEADQRDMHFNASHDDSLYDEACRFVVKSQKCTISSVQRELRVGYNRAARLVESMENNKVVSEQAANGSRKILMKD